MLIAVSVIAGVVFFAALAWFGLYRLGGRVPETRADETHMLVTPDLWRIRLCRYKSKTGGGEPVLLCHGFISNQFNWTLPDNEAIVDYLSDRGYDCWTIDLRGNLSSIPPFGRSYNDPTMDDYLFKDLAAAVDYVRKTTGSPQIHWIGHSMGGMLFYAYDAAFGGGKIASATTLGSPFSFDDIEFHDPSRFLFIRRALGRRAFRGAMRLLISVFVRLKPRITLVPVSFSNLHKSFFEPNTFYKAADTPPIKVAENLAQAAMMKSWRLKDGELDVFSSLHRLQTPIFAIFGADDPLTPSKTVDSFHEKINAPEKKTLLLSKENGFADDYSHLDLVFGKEAPDEVYKPIVEWLQAHPVAGQTKPAEAAPPKPRAPRKKPAAKKTPAAKKAAPKPPSARTRPPKAR